MAVTAQPKHRVLADMLRDRISGGELLPGDRLPSLTEMKSQFGVSQATFDRVHGQLEREGLIERRQGLGTFVIQRVERVRRAPTGSLSKRLSLMDRAVFMLMDSLELPPDDERHPGWSDFILRGALTQIRESGLHAFAVSGYRSVPEIVRDIVDSRPFGVILPEQQVSALDPVDVALELHHAGIPIVAFRAGDDLSALDRVNSDYEQGSYDLTRYLLARGRKRIVNVWPARSDAFWYAPRYAGYVRAMVEAGLTPQPIIYPPYSATRLRREEHLARIADVAEFMRARIVGEDGIDGILMVTDGYAAETGAMLRLLGCVPNEDVDLAGYDNYWMDADLHYCQPTAPVVTIDKNNMIIGKALVDLLADRCAGKLGSAPELRMVPQTIVSVDE